MKINEMRNVVDFRIDDNPLSIYLSPARLACLQIPYKVTFSVVLLWSSSLYVLIMYILVAYLGDLFSCQFFEYVADHINIKFRAELSVSKDPLSRGLISRASDWLEYRRVALFAISVFDSHYDF